MVDQRKKEILYGVAGAAATLIGAFVLYNYVVGSSDNDVKGSDNSEVEQVLPLIPEKRTECGGHLRSPDELVHWPQFPKGTKSLLSKFLTKEIWDMYHDKVDAAGVSFKQCIFSGC